ncbi:hypothetical protein ACIHDR_24815 [Nocardia sp. NPDC052278]
MATAKRIAERIDMPIGPGEIVDHRSDGIRELLPLMHCMLLFLVDVADCS